MNSYFEYFETDAEANPRETVQRIAFSDARTSLSLRFPGPRANLLHFIDLACAAPGFPVDVTHWRGGYIAYSGRLVYRTGKDEKPVISLATAARGSGSSRPR